jgi:NagD protein
VALAALGVGAADAVMVGDRIETDVMMGKQSGLATMLVLSGITQPDDPRIPASLPTT